MKNVTDAADAICVKYFEEVNVQAEHTLFVSQNVGTWRMIIQTWSKVTQGNGNQGIFTKGKVTHSNNIHTWGKSITTQSKDKVTLGKYNLGRY